MKYELKDKSHFPTKVKCNYCEGSGGYDSRPSYGGSRMESDDYYWYGCDYCNEVGYFYSLKTKCIGRRKVKL